MGRIRVALLLLTVLIGCAKSDPKGDKPDASNLAPQSSAREPSGAAAATSSARQAGGDPPEVVAKKYLELGAKGDLTAIADLVDPACKGGKIGEADAVRVMGIRMSVSETTIAVKSVEGDKARIEYSVHGSVDGKDGRTETDIAGKKVEIKTGSIQMKGVTQKGFLEMKKIGGQWVVTCAP